MLYCVFIHFLLQMEMLFCSTVVGIPFLVVPMILTGELVRAWNSCSQVNSIPQMHIITLYYAT